MKMGKTRGLASARSGSILVVVVFAVLILASLTALFATMSRAAQKENGQAVDELRAQYAAEAVLNEAYACLVDGGEDAVADLVYPRFVDDIELDLVLTLGVDTADLDDDLLRIVSVADRQGEVEAIEMIVRMGSAGEELFPFGIVGKKKIRLKSNSYFDAYESALGPYSSQAKSKWHGMQYADDDAPVASNGGISLDSNSSVYGDASPGPSSSVSTSGSSQVTGSTASLPEPLTLDNVVAPSISSPGGSLHRSSGTKTLSSGDYYYSSLSLDSAAKLIVLGPARILVKDFEVNSNASFEVDATNGAVEIWVLNDFSMSSNSWLAPTSDDPADVSLFFPGSGSDIEFDSNVYLIGTLYAPDRDVILRSNVHIYGALVGDDLEVDSDSAIHYDKSLAKRGGAGGGGGIPDVLCWRPVADPRP